MEHVVIIQLTDAGDYVAHLPEFPGCTARGGTVEDAEGNLRAAFDEYLASALAWDVPESIDAWLAAPVCA